MVRATWNLRRASNMENELLNVQMLRMEAELNRTFTGMPEKTRLMAAFSELAKQPALALLHRYANNLSTEYQRAFKALRELQKDVPIAPPGAPSETNPTAHREPATVPESASETNPTADRSSEPNTAAQSISETNPNAAPSIGPDTAPQSAGKTNPTADPSTEPEPARESDCETNPTANPPTEPEPAPESAGETNPNPDDAEPLIIPGPASDPELLPNRRLLVIVGA